MNRKNTILIAVLINAGLLAVLLIAALTTQEETTPATTIIGEGTPPLPPFDDRPLFSEPPLLVLADAPKEIPLAAVEETPLVHKLPPLVPEAVPQPPAPPVLPPIAAAPPLSEVMVKKGDNLDKIAKAHRTTVEAIIKLNHLPNSFLKVGQVLKIPTEKAIAATPSKIEKKPAETGPEYYTMKVGDNPWAIAMKHHMKVEELLRLNGLNEERARKLKPGDRLRIR